jgi:hypothetical protein
VKSIDFVKFVLGEGNPSGLVLVGIVRGRFQVLSPARVPPSLGNGRLGEGNSSTERVGSIEQ